MVSVWALCVQLFASISAGSGQITAQCWGNRKQKWRLESSLQCVITQHNISATISVVQLNMFCLAFTSVLWLIIVTCQKPLQTTVIRNNSKSAKSIVSHPFMSANWHSHWYWKGLCDLSLHVLHAWRSVLLGWKLILLCQSAPSEYSLPPSQIIPWKRQLFNA